MELNLTRENVPQIAKGSSIAVRPYFDEDIENMGLEKYGLSIHDAVIHMEDITCIVQNGIVRYITGLDETAASVKMIADSKEREAKILEIRKAVAELEKELASNIVDPKDKEFWNKVVLLKSNNTEFWKGINIKCGNTPVFLDPKKDPFDRILLYAIEAGGFSIIARSYEEAKAMATPPKFYLDKVEETASVRTEITKLRNKAKATLTDLFENNYNKLFYVTKVVDGNSVQYKKNTPQDVIYENMDNYIEGKGVEKNRLKAVKEFAKTADLDMETLKIRAVMKDAAFYKLIAVKADGIIYHLETNTMLGKNPSEVVESLKDPLKQDIWSLMSNYVEKEWNA